MSDVPLSEVLKNLSEETLFQLELLLERRVRRQALKVKDGAEPADLVALSRLQEVVQAEHHARLFGPLETIKHVRTKTPI